MTKADLKTGMVLVTRIGERYRVFKGLATCYTEDERRHSDVRLVDVVVNENVSNSWDYLDVYDDNLRYRTYDGTRIEDDDVVSVEMIYHPCQMVHRDTLRDNKNQVFYVNKPRYTYDELKAIVGHDFEFVTDAASCG